MDMVFNNNKERIYYTKINKIINILTIQPSAIFFLLNISHYHIKINDSIHFQFLISISVKVYIHILKRMAFNALINS